MDAAINFPNDDPRMVFLLVRKEWYAFGFPKQLTIVDEGGDCPAFYAGHSAFCVSRGRDGKSHSLCTKD
jgi:hypothetical protein